MVVPTKKYEIVDPMSSPRAAEFRDQIYGRQAEFERLDTDGDGFLSPEEYNGPVKMFTELDTDGDGRLSPDEAMHMMTFAEIPSGTFVMGTDQPIRAFFEPATDAGPAREVAIDAFKMSTTEVTNAQYSLYLNSALAAGEIVVKLGDAGGPQTRVYVPLPAYAVEGAPDTSHAGRTRVVMRPSTVIFNDS